MKIAKYLAIASIPLALSLTAMAKDVHQSTNEQQLVQANTVTKRTSFSKVDSHGRYLWAVYDRCSEGFEAADLRSARALLEELQELQEVPSPRSRQYRSHS